MPTPPARCACVPQPNGLDQNMPGTLQTLDRNALGEETLDRMATRILRSMLTVGALDWDEPACIAPLNAGCTQLQFDGANATSAAHTALAREIATEGAILLKNDGTLPLQASASSPLHIALVGSACDAQPNAEPSAVPWYQGDYYSLGGSSRVMVPPSIAVSIREGLEAIESVQLTVSADDSVSGALAAIGAAGVDVVVACGGVTSGEFYDRAESLELDQHAFLVGVAAANAASPQPPPLVVLAVASGPVLTDFGANASALVHVFTSGQETGSAFADILFGAANPSGKVPSTVPLAELRRDATS